MDQTAGTAQLTFTVTGEDLATALGSGDVPVLATPRLLAWCEAATVAAAAPGLAAGTTTVGTRVQLEHVAACLAGSAVVVRAETAYQDGRLLRFQVSATDPSGRLLATGEITRVVVQTERFLARVPAV